jgi:hypothetical protein
LSARLLTGVGHEPQPVPSVRGADARSREYGRPDGVVFSFQISRYKVEPVAANRCVNLLAKDDARAALADEPMPGGPEVPLVIKRSSFACRGERLARTGTGPNRSSIRPSGESKRERPTADTGEEVGLGVAAHVARVHVPDAALINVSIGNQAFGNEVTQPGGGVGVELVVVGAHRVGATWLGSTS